MAQSARDGITCRLLMGSRIESSFLPISPASSYHLPPVQMSSLNEPLNCFLDQLGVVRLLSHRLLCLSQSRHILRCAHLRVSISTSGDPLWQGLERVFVSWDRVPDV